ncbi:hypothetical protein [Actinomadura pelletieri]|uniref:hypothetical protein n=1 Tax=Actinomadura pelletieri TaxID=111805 RepID=UPI000EAED8DC|nr:hypothetical protein [Actinomadura pelletieri]
MYSSDSLGSGDWQSDSSPGQRCLPRARSGRHPRQTSGRTGQRLGIVLKRDAVAKIVLNNLDKHTQLQETFGANRLALVDGRSARCVVPVDHRYASPTSAS